MLNFLKQCITALCIGTILLLLATLAEAGARAQRGVAGAAPGRMKPKQVPRDRRELGQLVDEPAEVLALAQRDREPPARCAGRARRASQVTKT